MPWRVALAAGAGRLAARFGFSRSISAEVGNPCGGASPPLRHAPPPLQPLGKHRISDRQPPTHSLRLATVPLSTEMLSAQLQVLSAETGAGRRATAAGGALTARAGLCPAHVVGQSRVSREQCKDSRFP